MISTLSSRNNLIIQNIFNNVLFFRLGHSKSGVREEKSDIENGSKFSAEVLSEAVGSLYGAKSSILNI